MENGKVKNIYYLLLGILVVISLILVAILVKRAHQTDKYFEYKRSHQEERTYE